MRIAVVGQGYVGQALSKAAQGSGIKVIGIDVDAEKVRALAAIGYEVTTNFSMVNSCEIIVIAVPTPLNKRREPDLSHLESACKSLAPFVSPKTLIINESTSYPGTLRDVIAPLFAQNGVEFASAPERVDPGNLKWTIRNTPRLVAGLTDAATKRAADFYRLFCESVIEVSTPEVAEAAKLFENTFRQVNIALVNEFAQITNALGISTTETLKAAATKPYGFMPFMPSVGVGGHCIPIDPSYLSFVARKAGVESNFINVANEVNLLMPEFIAKRIDTEFGVKGKRIQIAGISYKAGVADTRESPALKLLLKLREMGGEVSWHDELVKEFAGETSKPISKVDIGVICTAHAGVDYAAWNSGTVVIDVSAGDELRLRKYL